MNYKIHVYVTYYDIGEPWVCIRREDLVTGIFTHLREGVCNWPEAIVKTLKDVGVEAALYEITEEQLKNADWHSATLIPETEW